MSESTKIPVIYDGSYAGFYRFHVTEAEVSKSWITINDHRHRKNTDLWALQTPELIKEAREINGQHERLQNRVRQFRNKMREAGRPQ